MMLKFAKYKVVLLLLVFTPCLNGQGLAPDYEDDEFNWRWGVFSGTITGDTLMETTVNGEFVSASSDSGWQAGLRLEADKEMWGIDISISTLQAELELRTDPFAFASVPSASQADMYLGGVNLLFYPTGNSLANGRLRPFITGGAGLGVYDSDFSQIDSELLSDLNAGVGIKWLLGDEGKTAFRVDYRHHLMKDFDNNFDNVYRRSITVGFSFDF